MTNPLGMRALQTFRLSPRQVEMRDTKLTALSVAAFFNLLRAFGPRLVLPGGEGGGEVRDVLATLTIKTNGQKFN